MAIWLWVGFIAFILAALALDLGVINRKAHVISAPMAFAWTGVTVAMALAFNVAVYFIYEHHWLGMGLPDEAGRGGLNGRTAALLYFTGWLVEYALSVDNIFVIAMIFAYFRIPNAYQHRVLFWGVLGALVMRGVMIVVGVSLIHAFEWMIYVFALILLITSIRMLLTGDHDLDPERGLMLRLARRFFRITPRLDGQKFFTRIDGKLAATPLFVVLLVIEATDLVFAVDSIPAIIGITRDPFLIFTSNVFAVLGLRSLYFALAAAIGTFRYLKPALVIVLLFVAIKMLLEGLDVHIPVAVSLGVIGAILTTGVIASLISAARRRPVSRRAPPIADLTAMAELAWARSRRLVILVVGLTILAMSIPVTLLPGPGGIFFVLGGLALLATEFVWARNLLRGIKTQTQTWASRADALVPRCPRPWLVPVVLTIYGGLLAALLLWLEHPHHRHWTLYAAAGPTIAIGWWATATIRRARQTRERAGGADRTVASPPPHAAELPHSR